VVGLEICLSARSDAVLEAAIADDVCVFWRRKEVSLNRKFEED
jgi:hypothetical protein